MSLAGEPSAGPEFSDRFFGGSTARALGYLGLSGLFLLLGPLAPLLLYVAAFWGATLAQRMGGDTGVAVTIPLLLVTYLAAPTTGLACLVFSILYMSRARHLWKVYRLQPEGMEVRGLVLSRYVPWPALYDLHGNLAAGYRIFYRNAAGQRKKLDVHKSLPDGDVLMTMVLEHAPHLQPLFRLADGPDRPVEKVQAPCATSPRAGRSICSGSAREVSSQADVGPVAPTPEPR